MKHRIFILDCGHKRKFDRGFEALTDDMYCKKCHKNSRIVESF